MSFRPWCPICDRTSSPSARSCETCGLYLYPRTRPVPLPAPTPIRPEPEPIDDLEDEVGVAWVR